MTENSAGSIAPAAKANGDSNRSSRDQLSSPPTPDRPAPDRPADVLISSDVGLLDLLRKRSPQTVSELSSLMGVTATAVRQRLTRLMGQGMVERAVQTQGRGRPSHQYGLTKAGRRKTGANFADLAVALWQEIRSIDDGEVRRGLLQRISRRLAEQYADHVHGTTLEEKMESLARMFSDRQIPFEVGRSGGLPVLNAVACPYPELAEQDRGICAMERLLFEEMLGADMRLSACRLDGDNCCEFEPRGATRTSGAGLERAPGESSPGELAAAVTDLDAMAKQTPERGLVGR